MTVDIQDVRRRALRRFIDANFADERTGRGSVNAFATALDRSQPMLADVLRGEKSFGEKLARLLEREIRAKGYDAPTNFLDNDPADDGVQEARAKYEFTRKPLPEEQRLLDRLNELPPTLRDSIIGTIESAWALLQDKQPAARRKRTRKREPA